jgi:hypothetical protein
MTGNAHRMYAVACTARLAVLIAALAGIAASASQEKTGATARIVFLSPHSNYYFTGHYLCGGSSCGFETGGRYRSAYGSSGAHCSRSFGDWSQRSNGLIKITFPAQPRLWGKTRGRRTTSWYAGVWQYQTQVFLIEARSLPRLQKRLRDVRADIDGVDGAPISRFIRKRPCNRLRLEMDIGQVNFLLGALKAAWLPWLPVWVLIVVNDVCWALLFILPVLSAVVLMRVRPRTLCPECGAELTASALRGRRKLRCRKCKTRSTLTLPIPWKVHLAMVSASIALMLLVLELLVTTVAMHGLLWWLLLICALLVVESAQNRLYARWLYRRLNAGSVTPLQG